MTDIPPISEMPVAETMRPTVRPTCGNCAFSADLLAAGGLPAVRVQCKRDGRGFDNHPVPNQIFPAERGACLHHQYRNRR